MTLHDPTPLTHPRGSTFCAAMRALELSTSSVVVAFAMILAAYAYQGMIPAFNADDVIQVQGEAGAHVLSQGRWGGYLVYYGLLDGNPAPFISTVIGSGLMLASLLTIRKLLGITYAISTLVFVVTGAVSMHYCELFSYDGTRINTPIANLLALYGLKLISENRKFLGVFLVALSPAFYPAAILLAVTAVAAMAIHELTSLACLRVLMRCVLRVSCIAVGVAIYKVFTAYVYWMSHTELGSRTDLDWRAAMDNGEAIAMYLAMHAVPFLTGRFSYYTSNAMVVSSGVIVVGFWLVSVAGHVARGERAKVMLWIVLNLALMCAPIGAAFVVGASDTLGSRSLYGYALVHGFCAATVLDKGLLSGAGSGPGMGRLAPAMLVACGTLYLAHAINIGRKSYDDYLATQSDLLATNRIIYRIESVLATADASRTVPPLAIPLAVIYERPLGHDPRGFVAGPRGDVGAARQADWSREWIFRLIDPKFRPIDRARRPAFLELARSHGEWPAADSVFIERGVVVVVISK